MADNTTFNPVVTSAIGAGGSLLGSIVGSISQSIQNKKQREFNQAEAEKQRLWNEEMYNKQNAWNYEMWQKTNEYNDPAHQLERLRNAGLNPLYFGLDGSSANAMSAASPLGYERAQASDQPNPFGSLSKDFANAGKLTLEGQLAKKDIELKNAQIDKLGEEKTGLKLDNEWKDRTMNVRVEAESIKNNLTKEQINQIQSAIKKNEQDIKESIARTENEQEKKSLIIAQAMLTKAQANEIAVLLPYKQLLMEAQTQAQKASAMASFVHASYEQGLIDAGYIDALVDQAASTAGLSKASAKSQEAMAALNAFKAAVKNGNSFPIDEDDFWIERQGKNFLNALFSDISIIGEAVTGSLSGLFK